MKKNYVCIIKVVLKKYSSTVVRENLYIKFICYVKVMLRIHPSKVYKMLYVKVVFTSSHFHKRKVCEEKKTFLKRIETCCQRSRATSAPGARSLISSRRLSSLLSVQNFERRRICGMVGIIQRATLPMATR